jgi:catechol 2,3-dioxygenase-like lactoylglutathione lyase family enzyme
MHNFLMGLLYASIRVKDMKKSLAFYKSLGMTVIGRRSHVPGEKIVMLASKETKQRLNLMYYSKSCMWFSPWKENGVELDHLMFEVKDAKKTYKKLTAKGAPAATKIWEGKERMMGFVKDPNGIWIGLMSRSSK